MQITIKISFLIFLAIFILNGILYGHSAMPTPAQKPNKKTQKTVVPESTLSIRTEEEAKNAQTAIQSLDVLIRTIKNSNELHRLYANRIKLTLSLAQRLQVMGKKNSDPELQKYLKEGADKTNLLFQMKSKNNIEVAEINYLAGSFAILEDQDQKAMQYFEKSLSLNPQSTEAPLIAFYVAERYFDDGNHDKSNQIYRKYYNLFNDTLRRMALYKIAWSSMNLNQLEVAKKSFMVLISQGKKDDLNRDSLRDLSYTLVRTISDTEILNFIDREFKTEEDRNIFLKLVFDQQEVQNTIAPRSKIFERILALEKDSLEKIRLQIKNMARNSKDYASSPHFEALQEIKKLLEDKKTLDQFNQNKILAKELDQELKKLVQAIYNTDIGKTKSVEKFSKAQLSSQLLEIIQFRLPLSGDNDFKINLAQLWLNIGRDKFKKESDPSILDLAAQTVKNETTLSSLKETALFDQITLHEFYLKKDASQSKEELILDLNQFHETYPHSKHWLTITLRLADLWVIQKQPNKAIPLFEKVFSQTPDDDILYKIELARFDLGLFDKVVNEPRLKTVPPQKRERYLELIRESSLKMAMLNKEKGNLKSYEAWLKHFIANQPNAEKAKVAKLDLLEMQLTQEQDQNAITLLLSLPHFERFSKNYEAPLTTLTLKYFKKGLFQVVCPLYQDEFNQKKPNQNFENPYLYFTILCHLAFHQPVQAFEIQKLELTRQNYLLNLISLLQPNLAQNIFKQYKNKNGLDPNSELMSRRFIAENWNLEENTLLKKLSAIRTPNPKMAKVFANHIELVHHTRNWLKTGLLNIDAEVQKDILRAALRIEKETATAILSSAMPPKLTPEQKKEYLAGLKEVATEFLEQSSEYEKLIETVSKKINTITRPKKMQEWEWGPHSEMIQKLVLQKRFTAAMITTDLNRDSLFKSDEDYFRIRAGILLFGNSSFLMPRYVEAELKAKKLDSILQFWRSKI